MPQTIDLYTPQKEAMAAALQLLQRRQAMNENARQFNQVQGLDEQKMRMLQDEAARKAAWEDYQHKVAQDAYDSMGTPQRQIMGGTILTDKVPNAQTTDYTFQNADLSPEQQAQRSRIGASLEVSPEDAAKIQATKDAAQIRANATVEAAKIRKANSGGGTTGGTPRATKPEKPFDINAHPQVKAYNQRLTEMSRTEQKLIDQYNSKEKDGDRIPIVRQLNSLRANMKSFITKRDELARRLMAQRTKLSGATEEPDAVEPDSDVDDNPLGL